jgi:hypothetical protein
MFERRHYIAIAEAFATTQPTIVDRKNQWLNDIDEVASMFLKDNPNFNWQKFQAACNKKPPA